VTLPWQLASYAPYGINDHDHNRRLQARRR
jgi:hypothetical protein